MTVADWLVVAGGAGAIAWVNWYFLLSRRPAARAEGSPQGVQEIVVTVKGGYEPAAVQVHSGRPVRLVFDRQESSGCSEEVVLGEFGIRRFLPPFRRTPIEFTPQRAGTFEFTCGMGMLRGRVVVE